MNILITGASSGLGAALRSTFRGHGINVYGTAVEPGIEFPLIRWDARSLPSTHALADTIASLPEVGPQGIDILVNNAGINAIRTFEDVTDDFLHDIFQVNCVAPIMLTQTLLRLKLLRSGSRVCNVVSDAAWRPMRHSLAYNCSKAALDMATKQMARELTKPYGLTIFGVRPGKMAGTEMSRYIDRQVCELRGWSLQEAQAYAAVSSTSGEEFSPINVAQVIKLLCMSRIPVSGACLDLVG